MVTLYLIIAFSLGFFVGIKFIMFSIEQRDKKEKSKIEEIFLKILENSSKLKFAQRVHTYVQIKTDKYLLVYMIDKHELAIFDKEECIANSSQINPEISNKIIAFIEEKFNKEINEDIVDVGGYLVSQSYIDEVNANYQEVTEDEYLQVHYEEDEEEYEEILNLDDILDKINISGINSLTNKEREFLNNYGK